MTARARLGVTDLKKIGLPFSAEFATGLTPPAKSE
jgi:hypothetical protein